MIFVFTKLSTGGRYRARAEDQCDRIGSNFPPTPLGVSAVSVDESKCALACARKAMQITKPYMVSVTTVKQVGAGIWTVNFTN